MAGERVAFAVHMEKHVVQPRVVGVTGAAVAKIEPQIPMRETRALAEEDATTTTTT